MRAAIWPGAPLGERLETLVRVAHEPAVEANPQAGWPLGGTVACTATFLDWELFADRHQIDGPDTVTLLGSMTLLS